MVQDCLAFHGSLLKSTLPPVKITPTRCPPNLSLCLIIATSATTGPGSMPKNTYEGMRCIASCIYNAYGEAIAGVSVSGPTVRFADQAIALPRPQVKQLAAEITRLSGGKIRT